ncbi:site-specific DNA-methyltransferase [Rubrivirga sp. SAORIC476]|uniref:site-specific DNA-methyltransferase n=1 Tax=Rubrivirga sp. SAORIC476 TaxID=1961794 RepID=UPI001304465F|nr:site-specific DNA-methyltransferase [Rubrivirga sp. SAORIC476]
MERPLSEEEARLLLKHTRPWLEWTGKREKHAFEVEPVALNVHERVSAQAVIRAAQREDVQRDLFADPQLPFGDAVKFYEHDVDWANRLILGDSLQVMASLARREGLAGKVQMVYIDPPYGINYASNFQPKVGDKNVKDGESHLTREPEMVKAYRDTWRLGIHSYLDYLRDRIVMAREMLHERGSVFVQISDENLHRVRAILDEVFGAENFMSVITFRTKIPLRAKYLAGIGDYLVWYARDAEHVKFHKLYQEREYGRGTQFTNLELSNGARRKMTKRERDRQSPLPKESKPFTLTDMVSAGRTESCVFDAEIKGEDYTPASGKSWKTNPEGFEKLLNADRIEVPRNVPRYVFRLDDYPVQEMTNMWTDTQGASSKKYVVQTSTKVVQRCLLMTTDPGDLVLDPTCGGGTTAYVAETWGRRWITIDTSRVGVAIARQRLLTASYPYFAVKADESNDPGRGFKHRTVPHITMGAITNHPTLGAALDKHREVLDGHLGQLDEALAEVDGSLRSKLAAKLKAKEKEEGKRAVTDADERRWVLPEDTFEHWTVPFDADEDYPDALAEAVAAYRKAWAKKRDEVQKTVAANAAHETLYDQPEVEKGVVRVSGPFTVEAVLPAEATLPDATESPIGGAPDALDGSFGNGESADAVVDAANAEAYLDKLTRLLREDGASFLGNATQGFDRLDRMAHSVLHAEGEWTSGDGTEQRIAVSFGPEHGPITAVQVEEALFAASRGGYDHLLFAGFNIDGAAQAAIEADSNPRVRTHLATVAPDVVMDDLLKKPAQSQLFTVFGQPRTSVEADEDGHVRVTMEGMDVYDPVKNALVPTKAQKVAAWFVDHDYDGRTFCVSQAFFPDKTAWKKLKAALKTQVDADAFARLSGTESLPFKPGKRVAVKVIDPRGNEALRVHTVGGATYQTEAAR